MPQTPSGDPSVADAMREIDGAFRTLGSALANTVQVVTAQMAFGRVQAGDLDQARATLSGLSTDALKSASAAATAFMSLIDDIRSDEV